MTRKKDDLIDFEEMITIHSKGSKLYHSLGQIIRGKIQSGEWGTGQAIPSERALMDAFSVSRATVRQAVDYLEREGILYRVHGKGTFVAPAKIQQGILRLLEFYSLMVKNGMNPKYRLLGKQEFEPPINIRQSLSLLEGVTVTWLQRLLLVNEAPMFIENFYFNIQDFPGLLEDYDEKEEPFELIAQQYGIKIVKASEAFEPVILESYEAKLLGVKKGSPALWVEYIAKDIANKPAAFITILMRGDRCRFYTDLSLE
jgi:GntR family transcriptional regulator